MSLRILSVRHDRHGLVEVGRTVDAAAEIAARIGSLPGVDGVMSVATCNRVELVVDASDVVVDVLRDSADAVTQRPAAWDTFSDDDAVRHLFRVAAGLESMVVGEREVAGQVRRSMVEASEAGTLSPALQVTTEEALKASRRIAQETALSRSGRSVVSVALDLADVDDWPGLRVLLVGTGAFAGASVAELRRRGTSQILVHSASGRADAFAATHGLTVADDLVRALAAVDLVVACRGTGTPVITAAVLPGTKLTILDLSLQHDVAPDVRELDGVRVVDLETVQAAVQPAFGADAEHAEQIIADHMWQARTRLQARALDPAVVGLRDAVMALVSEEVERLPQGRALTHDDAAHALRRLAARLLHVPSMRARQAAASGRTDAYLQAMSELYGIELPDAELELGHCPATGLGLADLDPHERQNP